MKQKQSGSKVDNQGINSIITPHGGELLRKAPLLVWVEYDY